MAKKSGSTSNNKTDKNSRKISKSVAEKPQTSVQGASARSRSESSPKSDKKFAAKQEKKRAKLQTKLKNLDQEVAPKHTLPTRILFAIGRFFRDKIWRKLVKRARNFLSRRPHRSFYLTERAAAKRSFKTRGYFAFVGDVWKLIWKNRWLFTKFLLLYAILSAIIVGLMSQADFATLRETIDEAQITGLNKWWTLFSGAVSNNVSGESSVGSAQQIIAVLLFLYGWLTLVWLLRRILNGDGAKLKLRDGLYSGGSAVLSTLCVLLFIIFQLLPFALVMLAYSAVTAVGWINTGIQIENMAAWCALAIIAVLTLYWISSSFIALIIVTLPGMYPFQATKAAGDLVVGRRVRLILRLIFMALPVALMWILILLPAILIDNWLQLSWQPLVPIIVLILTTLTIIWCATYIYLLYRRLVDDPAPPVSARKMKKLNQKNLNKKEKSKKFGRKISLRNVFNRRDKNEGK